MVNAPSLSVQFLKKEIYTGSCNGIRYLLKSEDNQLKACVYPEPYCFEATKDADKTWAEFPLSSEGILQALSWIENQKTSIDYSI